MAKFSPHELTASDIVNWIREGDFEQAKEVCQSLALFLFQLSENKEAQKALMEAGIFWIGSDIAKLISERLQDDPGINRDAQQRFFELIKAGHKKGSPELELALQKMKAKPDLAGKTPKTGAELFAKVLVPNKPTKRQFEVRWIASCVEVNIKGSSKQEYKKIANWLNDVIDKNNKIVDDWRSGKRDNHFEWLPGIPKCHVTPDQLEKYHRKYKPEIDAANNKANGITRHRCK